MTARMTDPIPTTSDDDWLHRAYDDHLDFDFFGLADSDYWNYGFWRPGTTSHTEACDTMMAILIRPLLQKGAAEPAVVLDVACGKGATTGYLVEALPNTEVIGINLSEPQIAYARRQVPQASFRVSDATRLDLADNDVDALVCVEAAVHFDDRRRFFDEARRVLLPGGLLLMSDVLMARWTPNMPATNYLTGTEDYRRLLEEAGFDDVRVIDVTARTWEPLAAAAADHVDDTFERGDIDRQQRRAAYGWLRWMDAAIEQYVLVSAEKPAGAGS